MMYRHVLADVQLYDAHNAGAGMAFHAQPRSLTLCGIPIGRFDDPDSPGAPPCQACLDERSRRAQGE